MFETNDPKYKDLRQQLRKKSTEAELKLWRELRNFNVKGYKFYRQYNVGRYILDFYCHKKQLCIELDGCQHATPEGSEYDIQRTAFLNSKGIKVLRFWNNEVFKNLEGVCKRILEELK